MGCIVRIPAMDSKQPVCQLHPQNVAGSCRLESILSYFAKHLQAHCRGEVR